jgi:hypothetical protein
MRRGGPAPPGSPMCLRPEWGNASWQRDTCLFHVWILVNIIFCYRTMAFFNCTTFFCELLSRGFDANCPVYEDCNPCWLENCTVTERVEEDCMQWECSLYPTTTRTTTTTLMSTTKLPPRVHENAAVAIIMAVVVLCVAISMTILWFLRRRRSSYVAFIDDEEAEDDEQDPEQMHLIGGILAFQQEPEQPNAHFVSVPF